MSVSKEVRPEIRQEISISPRRGRTFGAYCEVLGYRGREHELSGKLILDVGAGDSGFAQDAEKYGAEVVRIDPKYNPTPSHLTTAEKNLYQYSPPENTKNAVAGIAQELPFKNGTFDEVVALYSSFWIKTAAAKSIREMLRVTKDNGTITIWPAKFTQQETSALPSFLSVGKVNPDYGYPVSAVIRKDPGIPASEWKTVIDTTLVKAVVASDEQFRNAKKESFIVKSKRDIKIIGNY